MTHDLFQGSSLTATPIKQQGLVGIYHMIALRRKNYRKPTVFVDLYSGNGKNVVGDEIINGSPLSMLEGIKKAVQSMRPEKKNPTGTPKAQWSIVFNDIAPDRATDLLPENVMRWQEENRLPVNKDVIQLTNSIGHKVDITVEYVCGCAKSLVDQIAHFLDKMKSAHVVMMVDPNGPKHAPWNELKCVWERHHEESQLIFHISATALKRVAKARASTAYDFAPMPDHISALLDLFEDCKGWIRLPVGADQWTILMLSMFPPRNGWEKERFLELDSERGREAKALMSMTAKEYAARRAA